MYRCVKVTGVYRCVVMYLCPGHQLNEGPAVLVSDQLHCETLAGRQLMDAMVTARRAAVG